MISLLAFVFAACSAIAWYAASPHCMWSALRAHPQTARIAGFVLAMLSLALWISAFGLAAGLSAMLVNLMLVLVAQPYLALRIGTPDADVTSTEGN
jgi:hypothetical protein